MTYFSAFLRASAAPLGSISVCTRPSIAWGERGGAGKSEGNKGRKEEKKGAAMKKNTKKKDRKGMIGTFAGAPDTVPKPPRITLGRDLLRWAR